MTGAKQQLSLLKMMLPQCRFSSKRDILCSKLKSNWNSIFYPSYLPANEGEESVQPRDSKRETSGTQQSTSPRKANQSKPVCRAIIHYESSKKNSCSFLFKVSFPSNLLHIWPADSTQLPYLNLYPQQNPNYPYETPKPVSVQSQKSKWKLLST